MKKLYKTVVCLIEKINKDELTVYAAQGSFYLVISMIPFVMLLLAVSRFFLPITEADALGWMQTVLPDGVWPIGRTMIAEIFAKAPGSLVSVTALTTLWTASRAVAALGRGIGRVYCLSFGRGFISGVLYSVVGTLILIFVLIFTLAMSVFGKWILRLLEEDFSWLVGVMGYLRYPMNFVVLVLFFAGLYHGYAMGSMRWYQQLPGACTTAIGWLAFSWGFSAYVNWFADYSYIYGSLTALVLLMLWLYACTAILLFGAEINMMIKLKFQKGKE